MSSKVLQPFKRAFRNHLARLNLLIPSHQWSIISILLRNDRLGYLFQLKFPKEFFIGVGYIFLEKFGLHDCFGDLLYPSFGYVSTKIIYIQFRLREILSSVKVTIGNAQPTSGSR